MLQFVLIPYYDQYLLVLMVGIPSIITPFLHTLLKHIPVLKSDIPLWNKSDKFFQIFNIKVQFIFWIIITIYFYCLAQGIAF